MLALRLGILQGLDLTESVFQVGMLNVLFLFKVDFDLLLWCSKRVLNHQDFLDRLRRFNKVRVFNHLDFGIRLRRVKLAFIIGNSEAAGQLDRVGNLLDLGAGIEPRAGERGLAGSFPAGRLGVGEGKRPTNLECRKFLLESRGGIVVGPLLVVELGPKYLEGLLELLLESLHDPSEVVLDRLLLDCLMLAEPAPIHI